MKVAKKIKKQQKEKGKKEVSREQQGPSVKKEEGKKEVSQVQQSPSVQEKTVAGERSTEILKETSVQLAVSPPSEKDDLEKILHEKRQNTYIKLVLVGMAVVMILLVGFLGLRTKSMSFEYVGLQFEKTKFGQLVIYQTAIPITSITGEAIANYNLNLRNDPRNLESIPIEGRIRMRRSVLLALDPSMEDCQDNSFAGLNLAQFLAAAGVQAKGATTNKTYAEENGVPFASCETGLEFTIVITEKANATQIKKETEECYKIQVANCNDLVKATERFIVGVIGHSSGYDV